ncbi:cold shock domain-containing protein CG9705 [Lucilia sericata]|uniref:cold shock domain-containing protein CG9705 n=1 Tax=Lucilia sericata TaxID=13632 RepID=UPI0018A7ED9A|nr:cold shock domain-containing protein CG9705 [Lucilia sericata]XP_037821885.1 cold shock domain-containing protein CG9705 [Lucilia sericata]XP_037821886.1 cold shock domain-containing protein CG9705 [Lucilia sericata]
MSETPSTPEKLTPGKPPVYRRSSSGSPSQNLQLPSPIITKRTRTASTSARAMENPVVSGIVKSFSQSKGHGFITPKAGGDEVFCHISDIEGEYVPMAGDEVSYRLCAIPPKLEKFQAVHVKIVNLTPEVHHKWEE